EMRPRPRAAALGLAVAGAVSCAYYNGMWSADHLAKEARRLEASGRNVDARSYWSRAAVKAESMVVGHPNSRWAEDALVLQGEALARSGACARAQGTLALGADREGEWMSLLDDVTRAAGADAASGALDRLLARGRMPAGARGRLLLADADRLFAAGRTAGAAARYARVVQLVSDSVEGQRARVRRIRVLAAQADSLPDLTSARRQLERLTENGG